jgi:hypothetical protein
VNGSNVFASAIVVGIEVIVATVEVTASVTASHNHRNVSIGKVRRRGLVLGLVPFVTTVVVTELAADVVTGAVPAARSGFCSSSAPIVSVLALGACTPAAAGREALLVLPDGGLGLAVANAGAFESRLLKDDMNQATTNNLKFEHEFTVGKAEEGPLDR